MLIFNPGQHRDNIMYFTPLTFTYFPKEEYAIGTLSNSVKNTF